MISIELEGILRKQIRKKIFEAHFNKNLERKQIILEQEEPDLVFDEVATKELKKSTLQAANKFKKGFDMISKSEASAIAEQIYTATKGGWDFGMGTDEADIKNALDSCPTLMDVSFVSEVFERKYSGAWTFTPTLEAVFASELNKGDLKKYVAIPLTDKPFISIGGNKMSKEEFAKLIGQGEKIAKAAEKDVTTPGLKAFATGAAAGAGIATAGIIGGVATAGAVAGVTGVGAAGTALGTAAILGQTTIIAGGGTFASAIAAGAPTSVALGVAAGGGSAGAAITGASSALGSLIGGTVASGGTLLIVIAIAALAVGAYYLFAGKTNMNKQTKMALSSKAYKKVNNLFKNLVSELKAKAQTIRVMVPKKVDIPKEEIEDEEDIG